MFPPLLSLQPSLPPHRHRHLHLERGCKEGPSGVLSSLAPFLIFFQPPGPGVRPSTSHSQDSSLLSQFESHSVQDCKSLRASFPMNSKGFAEKPPRLLTHPHSARHRDPRPSALSRASSHVVTLVLVLTVESQRWP